MSSFPLVNGLPYWPNPLTGPLNILGNFSATGTGTFGSNLNVGGNFNLTGTTVSLTNGTTISQGGGTSPLTLINTADASSTVVKAGTTGGYVTSITAVGGYAASNPGSILLATSQSGIVSQTGNGVVTYRAIQTGGSTNAALFSWNNNSGLVEINSEGTTNWPIVFKSRGTELARITGSGNLLLKGDGIDGGQKLQVAGAIAATTGAANNALVARYNSSNSLFGVTVNSAGQGVISENTDASTGSDTYSKTGLPAFRLGNTGGSGTVPFWIDVAPSGTAGGAITWTNALKIDSSLNATFAGTMTAPVNKSAANYTTVTTVVAAGSTTTTVHTFANANINRSWIVSTRQQGSASNTVIGFATTYGGTLVVYRLAESNSAPSLDMNFTASGLNLQLTLASGFGTTTWDTTITPFQG